MAHNPSRLPSPRPRLAARSTTAASGAASPLSGSSRLNAPSLLRRPGADTNATSTLKTASKLSREPGTTTTITSNLKTPSRLARPSLDGGAPSSVKTPSRLNRRADTTTTRAPLSDTKSDATSSPKTPVSRFGRRPTQPDDQPANRVSPMQGEKSAARMPATAISPRRNAAQRRTSIRQAPALTPSQARVEAARKRREAAAALEEEKRNALSKKMREQKEGTLANRSSVRKNGARRAPSEDSTQQNRRGRESTPKPRVRLGDRGATNAPIANATPNRRGVGSAASPRTRTGLTRPSPTGTRGSLNRASPGNARNSINRASPGAVRTAVTRGSPTGARVARGRGSPTGARVARGRGSSPTGGRVPVGRGSPNVGRSAVSPSPSSARSALSRGSPSALRTGTRNAEGVQRRLELGGKKTRVPMVSRVEAMNAIAESTTGSDRLDAAPAETKADTVPMSPGAERVVTPRAGGMKHKGALESFRRVRRESLDAEMQAKSGVIETKEEKNTETAASVEQNAENNDKLADRPEPGGGLGEGWASGNERKSSDSSNDSIAAPNLSAIADKGVRKTGRFSDADVTLDGVNKLRQSLGRRRSRGNRDLEDIEPPSLRRSRKLGHIEPLSIGLARLSLSQDEDGNYRAPLSRVDALGYDNRLSGRCSEPVKNRYSLTRSLMKPFSITDDRLTWADIGDEDMLLSD